MVYFLCGFVALLFIFSRYSKKFYNPYRLIMVFGKKGSGKTTYLTKKAIKHLKKGWNVYTNIEEMEVPGVRFIDANDIGNFVPENDSLLLIDEVGLVWHARDFKSFPKETRRFFKLQRHWRTLCYCASQSYDIDKSLRDVCDSLILVTCVANCISLARPIIKKVVLTEAQGDQESRISENLHFAPIWNWEWTWLPAWAGWFDSHSVPDAPKLPYIER